MITKIIPEEILKLIEEGTKLTRKKYALILNQFELLEESMEDIFDIQKAIRDNNKEIWETTRDMNTDEFTIDPREIIKEIQKSYIKAGGILQD